MSLDTVLVVGGCGFTGFPTVQALLREPSCTSVHVLSRNPKHNLLPGVAYHAVDITSVEALRSILAKIQPKVIIHTAAPASTRKDNSYTFYYDQNVQGTKNLLDCAATTPSVKAFIYTSSVTVMVAMNGGGTCVDLKEDAPVLSKSSHADNYSYTKALADELVISYNRGASFRTVSLRPTGIYGEGENQTISGALDVMKMGRQIFQVGDNKNLFEFVSVENVAMAHVLAAKALIRGLDDPQAPKVDGEAFFITDGNQEPFWTFLRKVWTLAGDRTPMEKVWILPVWFMLTLCTTVEWIYWIFTFNTRRPAPEFRRSIMEYGCLTHTFSIGKARERLGYEPLKNYDKMLADAVQWALDQETEKPHGKKD